MQISNKIKLRKIRVLKRIFIITMATNLPDEKGYNRFKYLSEILSEDNFDFKVQSL